MTDDLPPIQLNSAAPGGGLTPGIRGTVLWLRSLGFRTTDSGDGTVNPGAGMEGAWDIPHVIMEVPPDRMLVEADRLHALVEALGLPLSQVPMEEGSGQMVPAWQVEAHYAPGDGTAVLLLTGVDDAVLATRGRSERLGS